MHLTNLLQTNNLNDFIGQKHIIGKNTALYNLIKKQQIPHLFFYGKPGTGKTTLAKIIAKELEEDFYNLNATSLKIETLRNIFKKYENSLLKPLIFIDEVHRLSTTQQEVLLPIMENYSATIIGASTSNPAFCLTSAIRSRSFIYEFKPHTKEDLNQLLTKVFKVLKNITIDKQAKEYLITSSNGDARAMLNLIDFAYKVNPNISFETLQQIRTENIVDGMSDKNSHYDLISALIKSIRGSDIDASIYYLARLIDGKEDLKFLARRLIISSSEDIGNANPNALNLAVSTYDAVTKIGYPEARIILAQCVVYLASSPKSNSSYKAINKALEDIKNGVVLDIPPYIKDNAQNYQNPHNFNGYVDTDYLMQKLNYYQTSKIGFEKTLDEWNHKIRH